MPVKLIELIEYDKRQTIKDILSSNDTLSSSDEFSSADESDSFDDSKYKLNDRQKLIVEWMVNCEREKPHGGIIATHTSTVNDKLAIIMGLFFKSKPHYLDDSMPDADIDSDGNTLEKGCTLILCCKSSWSQWVQCIKNTISSDVLDVCMHYGKQRDVSFENLSQRDIVITTVGIARLGFGNKNKNPLFNIKWDRIILDDPQCTHYDFKLQTSRAICQLQGVCRWVFIASNNIDNIDVKYTFSLIKFINNEPFYNFEVWKKWLENNPKVPMKDMFSYIVYSEKMC